MSTGAHKEAMWKGSSNILVAVRCRPITSRETRSGQGNLVKVLDHKVLHCAVGVSGSELCGVLWAVCAVCLAMRWLGCRRRRTLCRVRGVCGGTAHSAFGWGAMGRSSCGGCTQQSLRFPTVAVCACVCAAACTGVLLPSPSASPSPSRTCATVQPPPLCGAVHTGYAPCGEAAGGEDLQPFAAGRRSPAGGDWTTKNPLPHRTVLQS